MGQSEILNSSQIIFITLFSIGGTPLLRLSAITANRANHAESAKTTFLSQTQTRMFLTFLHPILLCSTTTY
jgi:hypothetical protein